MSDPNPPNVEDFPATADEARALATDPATVPETQPEPTELETVTAMHCNATLAYYHLQHCVQRLLDNAQIHPATAGKRNARLLIYEDRAEELREVAARELPPAQEAVQFWEDRTQQTEHEAGLHRMAKRLAGVVNRLEAQAGVKPLPNDGTPMDERIEQIASVLIDIVQQQAKEIQRLRSTIKSQGQRTGE